MLRAQHMLVMHRPAVHLYHCERGWCLLGGTSPRTSLRACRASEYENITVSGCATLPPCGVMFEIANTAFQRILLVSAAGMGWVPERRRSTDRELHRKGNRRTAIGEW